MGKRPKRRAVNTEKQLMKFLDKFSKKDIIANILLKKAEKQDIQINKKKPMIIRETLEILMEKFSDMNDLILFLHYQYAVCVNPKKKWIVLLITNAKRLKSNLTAEKVSTSIHKYFTKYNTKCKVLSEMEGCCIWIVLLLESNKYPVHCVVHLKLSLIFVYNLRRKIAFLTEKVLRKTFRGSDIQKLTDYKSKGEDIVSLTVRSWNSLYEEIASQNKERNAAITAKEHSKIINEQNSNIDSEVQSPRKKPKQIELKRCDKQSESVRQIEVEEHAKRRNPVRHIESEECDKESEAVGQIELEEHAKRRNPVRQIESEECDEESESVGQIELGEHAKKNELIRRIEFEDYDEESEPVRQIEFEDCDKESEQVRQIDFEECGKESDPVIQDLDYEIYSSGIWEKDKRSTFLYTYIKFQGTNILKGLDKVIECGIADAFLPDYLYKEPKSGKTEYTIKR